MQRWSRSQRRKLRNSGYSSNSDSYSPEASKYKRSRPASAAKSVSRSHDFPLHQTPHQRRPRLFRRYHFNSRQSFSDNVPFYAHRIFPVRVAATDSQLREYWLEIIKFEVDNIVQRDKVIDIVVPAGTFHQIWQRFSLSCDIGGC